MAARVSYNATPTGQRTLKSRIGVAQQAGARKTAERLKSDLQEAVAVRAEQVALLKQSLSSKRLIREVNPEERAALHAARRRLRDDQTSLDDSLAKLGAVRMRLVRARNTRVQPADEGTPDGGHIATDRRYNEVTAQYAQAQERVGLANVRVLSSRDVVNRMHAQAGAGMPVAPASPVTRNNDVFRNPDGSTNAYLYEQPSPGFEHGRCHPLHHTPNQPDLSTANRSGTSSPTNVSANDLRAHPSDVNVYTLPR